MKNFYNKGQNFILKNNSHNNIFPDATKMTEI